MYIAMDGYSIRLVAALLLEFPTRSSFSGVLEHAKILLPFFAIFGVSFECLLSVPFRSFVPVIWVGLVRQVSFFSVPVSTCPTGLPKTKFNL